MIALVLLVVIGCASCIDLQAQIRCLTYAVESVDSCNGVLLLDRSLPSNIQRGSLLLMHTAQTRGDVPCEHVGVMSICRVDTVAGNRVFLAHDLSGLCCSSDRLQIVVPLTGDVINGADTLTCLPWNGLHGGVIALVDSVIDLRDVVVNASAQGFRGGHQMFPQADTSNDTQTMTALSTGESIIQGQTTCAGMPGPARNAGGSGGSSITTGGNGGGTSSVFTPMRPGARSSSVLQKPLLSFGAGGGAGHRNDISCADGARGGGLIIIIADTILTNQNTHLSAAGGNACAALADGAGGGGAGGVIAIVCTTAIGQCSLRIKGGNGGDVLCTSILSGPGGGGAGGNLIASQNLTAASIDLSGGKAGARLCDTTSDVLGSTDGAAGVEIIRTDIVRTLPARTGVPIRLCATDTVLEYGDTAHLTVQGNAIVTWVRGSLASIAPDGKSATTEPITGPIWVVIQARTASGCVVYDSVRLRPRIEANTLNIEADYVRAAPGDTVDLFLRFILSTPYNRALQGSVTVSTHAPVAFPVRSARISQQRASIEIPFTLLPGTTSTFRREPLAVMLGDSVTTQISIDSAYVTGAALNVRRRHGRLTLDSICIAGGRTRLFDPTASLLRVEGRTIHARADEMFLTDLLGRDIGAVITAYAETVTAQLPDNVHGLVLIVMIQSGRPLYRSIWIE